MAYEDDLLELKVAAAAGAAALSEFVQIVERYMAVSGRQQSEFGEQAAGSRDFVRHMREGRDFRLSTVLRVLSHVRDA